MKNIFRETRSQFNNIPPLFAGVSFKLGLDGIDGDPTGITDLVADVLNGAWDWVVNAVRVVLYLLLTVPLMITGALSDAVDIISGIKPVYTETSAIVVPYAGTIPPCKYDDFIVFDTFYQVTQNVFKNHGDNTLNKERYNFRETVPDPFNGNWVAYRDVPGDRDMLDMYYQVRPDIRNGDYIEDFLAKARNNQMMNRDINHRDAGYNAPIAFPAPYSSNGITYYGKSLDQNTSYVNNWKGQEVYRFTSDQDFADYYIAHTLYRNSYEPNGYKYESLPELLPYYIPAEEAFKLKGNELNVVMRTMSGRVTYENGTKESDKKQFSGYDSEFFAHVQCRQMYYYTHWSGGLVRAVKNYYSHMFLYSAKPIWQDYIDHADGLAANPGDTSGKSAEWGYWDAEFQEFMKANDLLPGTDDMYRFTANWIADGKQMYSVYEESREQGQTLLSMILGQSVISFVFWGITLISFALCLFFTIISVIRSMGDLGLKRPVGKIMGDTGKAMITFLLIPVLMIVAVNLSTVGLRQIDALMDNAITGTEQNQNINMATAIFYTALTPESMMFTEYEQEELERVAGTPKESELRRLGYQPTQFERKNKLATVQRQLLNGTLDWQGAGIATTDIDPFGMNYIPALIAAWFSVIIMTMILMLFIRRMYEVVLLYLAAPFFVSAIPLDEGNKFKSWREMFIAKVIQGFSSIITLKLYLIFVPLLWNGSISFHSDDLFDGMLKLIFMVGTLYAAYKSHTMITGIFSRQAESMEKETAAFAHQVFSAAKDVALLPANLAKDKVVSDIYEVKGDIRRNAAQGIIDTNANIRKGAANLVNAPVKAAVNAFRTDKK